MSWLAGLLAASVLSPIWRLYLGLCLYPQNSIRRSGLEQTQCQTHQMLISLCVNVVLSDQAPIVSWTQKMTEQLLCPFCAICVKWRCYTTPAGTDSHVYISAQHGRCFCIGLWSRGDRTCESRERECSKGFWKLQWCFLSSQFHLLLYFFILRCGWSLRACRGRDFGSLPLCLELGF